MTTEADQEAVRTPLYSSTTTQENQEVVLAVVNPSVISTSEENNEYS